MLQALGGGEKLAIDCRCANRVADEAHRFTYDVEESGTGVLDKMPAIGDLDCVRQRTRCGLAVPTSTIARWTATERQP